MPATGRARRNPARHSGQRHRSPAVPTPTRPGWKTAASQRRLMRLTSPVTCRATTHWRRKRSSRTKTSGFVKAEQEAEMKIETARRWVIEYFLRRGRSAQVRACGGVEDGGRMCARHHTSLMATQGVQYGAVQSNCRCRLKLLLRPLAANDSDQLKAGRKGGRCAQLCVCPAPPALH